MRVTVYIKYCLHRTFLAELHELILFMQFPCAAFDILSIVFKYYEVIYMYGAILGDMIGAPYEFHKGERTKNFPLFSEKLMRPCKVDRGNI